MGIDHPHVATSLNNLALIYEHQGEYSKAEPLYRRSLAIWEKSFGPDHPQVAAGLRNYAMLLRDTGRFEEALELEARAAPIEAKQE